MPWPQDALPVAFTTSEAEAAGISRHRLNRAQRSGRLWRPTPGVYVELPRFTTQSWPDRHRALARVAPLHVPNSVVSHVSAALLSGLPHPPAAQGQVRLTVERTPRVNRPSDWVHLHRAGLPADHVTTLDGIPVTTAARTVVDCCRELRTPDAVAIADAALRAGSVTEGELVSMFAFQHRPSARELVRVGVGRTASP
jgi:predicted transcriptional regulator of viral defense system